MPARLGQVIISIVLLAAGVTAPIASAKKKTAGAPAAIMDERKRAVHALNRLAFGPRPGEVERVTAMGVDRWIEQQLHPEKIDDSAIEARLAPFRTLRMSTREIVENFPPNLLIKQVAEGKAPLPRDPAKRAVYEAQLQLYEARQEKKEGAVETGLAPSQTKTAEAPISDTAKTEDSEDARRREERQVTREKVEQLLDLPPDERMKEILRMTPEEQRALAAVSKGGRADALMDGMNAQQKETLMALKNPEQVVVGEVMQAKLLRAIYSERQLDEVMTDFWMNHFNVFINKGADRYLLTSYERDTIHPRVMGKFEDLLVATAKSPAMLFYLDNWMSVGPDSEVALGIQRPRRRGRRGYGPRMARRPAGQKKFANGLNENYGRELMELHTLSVNGGYAQRDVTEVAKVFTGWTLEGPRKGGGFRFEPRMHEPGDKVVLGHRIKQNGEKEGLEVLHILARSPKTAHFISEKLATRFVSDDPPATLVERMTQTFLKKDGDIREVLRTMFQSPEFWAPEAYRAKVKTPLEFVVSAVRASGAQVEDARPLVGTLNNMGMLPYGMMPPTGYSMKAAAWVNSSALLGRMNFALGLTSGKMRGITVDAAQLTPGATDAQQALAAFENSILSGDVSPQTHETVSKQLEDPKISQRRLDDPSRPPNVGAIAGLILGSPEFQRR
jgi:uncharacterized protein (DUF1800 family)